MKTNNPMLEGHFIMIAYVIEIFLTGFLVKDTSELTDEQLPDFIEQAQNYAHNIKCFHCDLSLYIHPDPPQAIEEFHEHWLSHDYANECVEEIRYLLTQLS